MFLSLMESILMVKMLSIDYIRIIFNMMKVWYLFYSSLESTELVNQIIPHIKQIEDDDNPLVIENEDDYAKLNDNNWSSMIVKEGLFEEMKDELILNDYSDAPFTNGMYTHGKYAFYRLYSNHIQYDEGMILIIFFIRIYWIIQSNSSSYQTNREWW